MKRLLPTQIFRVSRHAPSPIALSPNKSLLLASLHTRFATFLSNSQLPSASCHPLCSVAQPRCTSTPALHSIQFPWGPHPPQPPAASFKSLNRKRSHTPRSVH